MDQSVLIDFFKPCSSDEYIVPLSQVQVTPSAPRRRPGRPKKKVAVNLIDASSSSTSSSSSSSSSSSTSSADSSTPTPKASVSHTNWFSSPHIHDILEAVRVYKSSKLAIEHLQKKFRKLPTEQCGRFDSLKESTIRSWFNDDWILKPQYQYRLDSGQTNYKGCKHVLDRPDNKEIKEKIIERLKKMRDDDTNATLNIDIVRTIMMKMVKKYKPEIIDDLKFSRCFISLFIRFEMKWSMRRGTTAASKLPVNWTDLGVAMVKRMAAIIKNKQIHKSLIINIDQTGIELVPASKTTYDAIGKKSIALVGQDDKRQITAVLGSSASGELLPLQLIFGGKTERSHPIMAETIKQAGFHFAHSENHWSNQQTMKEYITNVIIPYRRKQIDKHQLASDSKLILQLDCWSVHRSDEFISWIKKNHRFIELLFIPPNCTSKLQVADVALQKPFKWGIKRQFNQWLADIIEEQIESEAEKIEINSHLRMAAIKPLLMNWVYESWDLLGSQPELIMRAWSKCMNQQLNIDPFDPAVQQKAVDECMAGHLIAHDFKFENKTEDKDNDEEKQNFKETEEEECDEKEDELDLMKKIVFGERRSGRKRKDTSRTISYYIDSSAIESGDDQEVEEL